MQVQSTFFGMHISKITTFPLNVPAGSIRHTVTIGNKPVLLETGKEYSAGLSKVFNSSH
jgi:hypothetical protein